MLFFGVLALRIRIGFGSDSYKSEEAGNLRKKATGNDPEILEFPHITMVEAARIFGWAKPKFRKMFGPTLSWRIRSCMRGTRRFLSLIDTVEAAYPEADNQTRHMMAANFNERFFCDRSRSSIKGVKTRRENNV